MAIDTVTNESILDQYGGVRINSLDLHYIILR